ncbi:hypothetical protein MCOR27_001145 [Pyricularia oryzae]|uniref:Rhodopsin domain-containing protein n=2 Tax=Pyricularia TaxID=48558 RepID=A0ABQ8P2V0_PYRGI|nr:hypothetical protein MCOR01_003462 [Pyricularia oryzae]KAI6304476.1 hypothetical protein MCOR33_000568 [Pyricularia grisea]KAI6251888.1 hypothetical protein MCOR19_011489 [Pyricularia oryzae]KAI6281911.1 hypothetical protein MCOR26_003041 [Pyricularia oryzae]KAI6287778.1 hypothetical protein MCOR27_001145 [Pyricularia oryzae]
MRSRVSNWATVLLLPLLLLSHVCITPVAAQDTSAEDTAVVLQLLKTLPSCALACSSSYPPDCPATRKACLCAPQTGKTLDCIFSSCTGWDVILSRRATSVACDEPFPQDGRILRKIAWACTGVGTLAVLVRFGGRLATAMRSNSMAASSANTRGFRGLWWDDALLFITFIFMVGIMAMSEVALRHGFGDGPWVSGPSDLNLQGLLVFIGEPIYFATSAALKASFLFLFARIFAVGSSGTLQQRWGLPLGGPSSPLRDRWTLAGVLLWAHIVNVVVAVTFTLVVCFQCQPLDYFWKGWDGITPGTCINRKAVPLAHGVVSIMLDIWILIIPLCLLPALRVSFWTKIGIASMFCVGTLTTVVSAIRCVPVSRDINSRYSLTWNQTEVLKWTQIELVTGIVCACMPGHGALVARLVRRTKRLFGISTTTGASTNRSKSGGVRTFGSTGPRSFYSASAVRNGTVTTTKGAPSSVTGSQHQGIEVTTEIAVSKEQPWGSTVELRNIGSGSSDDYHQNLPGWEKR